MALSETQDCLHLNINGKVREISKSLNAYLIVVRQAFSRSRVPTLKTDNPTEIQSANYELWISMCLQERNSVIQERYLHSSTYCYSSLLVGSKRLFLHEHPSTANHLPFLKLKRALQGHRIVTRIFQTDFSPNPIEYWLGQVHVETGTILITISH